MSDDDDAPSLSAHAMAALAAFYQEQRARDELMAAAEAAASQPAANADDDDQAAASATLDIDHIHENWQLSQFWYDAATIDKLASAAVTAAGASGSIALLSTPSLYKRVKELAVAAKCRGRIVLLEYDTRFKVYPDFVEYDYNHPLTFKPYHASCAPLAEHSFDVVVADPPFLAEECLTKTSESVKYLAKRDILLCTGLVMRKHAANLLGLRLCQFRPVHSGGRLSNEFACYANFDSALGWDTTTTAE
ncbi:N(6)-adenine-specific DNA methyltransferase 2 [Capsaspora owczarzaki ATCC 30864]|uniref:Protein-lysine N-methyltransferase CAOG_004401 n=1 Tax=Capsaspora owczarzaki (strain ATCC 30864) TaxID=595528 RepID=A0A0D2UEY6_CAPO3|nr:N(6)-adenine-specific DNA methyltransferase 2 [Capsaspora owczarzaki ATCC 30864]KJE93646.1 N(6)-adenine-specific DNA methyltransferase 2 [Capsaspora owczarzaki ATCC 30864]|eukprot:XP_004348229.2 N(6)-adenine-specific DNA methyltransferase 2 [Capsaspora owczarzaki ATCC 30864]